MSQSSIVEQPLLQQSKRDLVGRWRGVVSIVETDEAGVIIQIGLWWGCVCGTVWTLAGCHRELCVRGLWWFWWFFHPILQQPGDIFSTRCVSSSGYWGLEIAVGGGFWFTHDVVVRGCLVQGQGFTQGSLCCVNVCLQPSFPLPLWLCEWRCCAPILSSFGLQLLQLLLQVGVPVILYVVVRPLWKVRGYGRPSAPHTIQFGVC